MSGQRYSENKHLIQNLSNLISFGESQVPALSAVEAKDAERFVGVEL